MADSSSYSTFSLSSFLCPETENSLDDDDDEEEVNECTSETDENEEEYVQILLDREREIISSSVELETRQSSIGNWNEQARLDAIQWIVNTRELLGFQFHTAYLSVTYIDRFLSRRIIDSEKHWGIRLLSVACLSLAAKMEECKVPMLSEFPVEDYNFESKVIERMELLVLNTLEWRMVSITPFAYIHYFILKFCKQSPKRNAVSIAIELLFASTRDRDLMSHRSSTLAVAATLMALDKKLTRQSLELKMNASSLNRFLEIGDVYSCYNRMLGLELDKNKLPQFVTSPDLSPAKLGRTNILENSAVSTKRKRLTFDDRDQKSGTPEKKPHL